MAEPNTLEWMTEQRDRLKAECDLANTRYDKLVAEGNAEATQLRGQVEQMKKELSVAVESLRHEHAEAMAQQTDAWNEERRRVMAAVAELQDKLAQTQKLAAARRLALVDVMKAVQGVLEKVTPLLVE